MNIDKEFLKNALSPLIASIPADALQFEFEGERSDNMSEEELRELLLNEYSNDKVVEYVNNAMQKVYLFEAKPDTLIGDITNEIDTAFSDEIDKSHIKPLLIDELACVIGTFDTGWTSTTIGTRYASKMGYTWLTETGKIIVIEDYEYGESFGNQPEYIIRKIVNDMRYANAIALEELVDEWAKDIWEQ